MVLPPAPGDELLFAGPDLLAQLLEDRAVDGRELHVALRALVLRDSRGVELAALALLPLQRELGAPLQCRHTHTAQDPRIRANEA